MAYHRKCSGNHRQKGEGDVKPGEGRNEGSHDDLAQLAVTPEVGSRVISLVEMDSRCLGVKGALIWMMSRRRRS